MAACRIRNYIYLLDAQKVYKEMPDLLRFLPQYIAAHDGNSESKLHVEPKANGESVVQMLQEVSTLNVKRTPTPTDDKEVRLRAVSPRVECGRVFIVEGSWNDDFLDEVCGFPSQPHDEFVDILGYAINDLFEDDDDINYDLINKSIFRHVNQNFNDMMLFDLFRNYLNALVGHNQEFEKLLAAKRYFGGQRRDAQPYGYGYRSPQRV